MHVCNREFFGYIDKENNLESAREKKETHIYNLLQHLSLSENIHSTPLPKSKFLKENNQKTTYGFDKIYVISLERCVEKRERIKNVFNELNLNYEIFDAVDGVNISENYLESLGIQTIPNYLNSINKSPMNYGELGCFLNHYFIWKDVSNNFF